MADLTLAQILALFPDNSTGAIDASDVREALTAIFERTDGTNPIEGLRFATTGGLTSGDPGTVFWNGTFNTLDIEVDTNGTLQVGHESYILARNTTGATILDGRPVRISGGQGTNALISLANGTGEIAGLATEDIPNNSTGRVTTFGVVNNINTQAFNDGDTLYASSTGTLTTTLTASRVGTVLNASPTEGRVLVQPRRVAHASGTTAQRPTTVFISFMYFDTTLGIPIWWNGAAWVNASGAVV